MSWIDKKYIDLISPRIDRFKWKSGKLANGRCPLCGDSVFNHKKMRLFIFLKKDEWRVFCHNCGLNTSLPFFIKRLDERLYREYQIESFGAKHHDPQDVDYNQFRTVTKFDVDGATDAFNKLKKISQLRHDHIAKQYIVKRMIPNYWHSVFRWCPDFNKWINNEVIPGKFSKESLAYEEGRIVFPFYYKHKLHALQGRSIGGAGRVRYISIAVNTNIPLIWFRDGVDDSKSVFVFEGILDALFIPNAIAICGSNIASLTNYVNRNNIIMAYDFERHSKETKKKILHSIDQGFKVVIPPDNVIHKDINEMIINGYSADHIEYLLKSNVYEGLNAKIRLNEWSKR